jgi:hypothetical protein
MRDITTTVYKFDELDDSAQAKAVEQIRDKLAADWWDSSDNDQVTEEIVYTIAEQLKTPGWDTYGPGDFPGIPHLTIKGWDLERGEYVSVQGRLNAENAPALPWSIATHASLTRYRHGGQVEWFEDDSSWPLVADMEEVQALQQAWENVLHAAIKAGRDAIEYKTSEEYARDWLAGNDNQEFDEEGNIA